MLRAFRLKPHALRVDPNTRSFDGPSGGGGPASASVYDVMAVMARKDVARLIMDRRVPEWMLEDSASGAADDLFDYGEDDEDEDEDAGADGGRARGAGAGKPRARGGGLGAGTGAGTGAPVSAGDGGGGGEIDIDAI